MWPGPRIHAPIDAEGFLNGKFAVIGQQDRVIVIHADHRQMQAGCVPGQVEVSEDDLRWGCHDSRDPRSLFWPFRQGMIPRIDIRLRDLCLKSRAQTGARAVFG